MFFISMTFLYSEPDRWISGVDINYQTSFDDAVKLLDDLGIKYTRSGSRSKFINYDAQFDKYNVQIQYFFNPFESKMEAYLIKFNHKRVTLDEVKKLMIKEYGVPVKEFPELIVWDTTNKSINLMFKFNDREKLDKLVIDFTYKYAYGELDKIDISD